MKNFTISVRLLFFFIVLTGCLGIENEVEPSFSPPGNYSQVFSPLDASAVMEIVELTRLPAALHIGPVATARYFPEKNLLLAVYIGDGFLRAWDLGNSEVLYKYNLGITSNKGVGFEDSGDLLMGATLHETRENDYGEMVEYIGGVGVWNAVTGSLVACVIQPCETTPITADVQRIDSSGTTLDPQGRWIIKHWNVSISVFDITGTESSYGISQGRPGHMRHIAQVAFDPNGNRYAIAFREGEILIEQIGNASLNFFSPRIRFGNYDSSSQHKVSGLSFSPNGNWIVRIQDDVLSIWEISKRGGKLRLELEVPGGQSLAFDQSSKMLFVGTTEKIWVLEIDKMQFIEYFDAPEITSMSVSADNRLLIWGDKSGTVHVWGIP